MKVQQFNFDINVMQALLWRFNDATKLQTILQKTQDLYTKNHTEFWKDWYKNVFNLLTANDFGLVVWSIILDQPLHIGLPIVISGNKWGFGKPTNHFKNFGHGNFGQLDNSVSLSTEERRLILRLKAFKISSDCNPFTVNPFYKKLFAANGIAYITDTQNMQMKFKSNFELNPRVKKFMEYFDLVPRPAGVQIIYEVF